MEFNEKKRTPLVTLLYCFKSYFLKKTLLLNKSNHVVVRLSPFCEENGLHNILDIASGIHVHSVYSRTCS